MKKYRVNVNGVAYEVEVEELTDAAAVSAAPASAPAPAPKAEPASSGKGELIAAPMPGNILNIFVKAGDEVKAGQVLMILEAMKMENEIMCPKDGRVVSVKVDKGAVVESGTPLCEIE